MVLQATEKLCFVSGHDFTGRGKTHRWVDPGFSPDNQPTKLPWPLGPEVWISLNFRSGIERKAYLRV
jgi:hypothetical protein